MSAKSVWSLPNPTPGPGKNLVPRWRTRMLPALTTSPPYRFTPSRWELLSRPFLVEPCPFLCAMNSASDDLEHLQVRLALPVPPTLAHVLLGLVVEGVDLPRLALADDLRLDLGPLDER